VCKQVLTRFATNKTMRGIESYNDMSLLAKHEDLIYAVRGEVQHNLHTNSKRQYDFPLERDNDPLSLMEQCHAIMRARTFTQPATEVDEPNHGAAGSATRRRMITLEAIMDYVQEGVEWKPMHQHANQTDKAHLSRREIVRVIHEYASNMPLNILYDARFVSHDSHFCETTTPEPEPRPQKLAFRTPIPFENVLYELDQHLQTAEANKQGMPVFGMAARTIGNADILCPCETRTRTQARQQECVISFKICEMGQYEGGVDRSFFNSVFRGCTAESRVDNAHIIYAARHHGYARSLLRKYNTLLKASGFVCGVMQPSDLWGLGISHFNNTHYLNASHMGELGLDVVDMLLHPKSGVSILNYEHVRKNFHTVLSDGDREVFVTLVCPLPGFFGLCCVPVVAQSDILCCVFLLCFCVSCRVGCAHNGGRCCCHTVAQTRTRTTTAPGRAHETFCAMPTHARKIELRISGSLC